MAKPVAKIGDEVRIDFIDHVEGTDEVERYLVYGRVAKVTRESYTVDSWAMKDPSRDRDADRDNITTFTIIRGTIKGLHIYDDSGRQIQEKARKDTPKRRAQKSAV